MAQRFLRSLAVLAVLAANPAAAQFAPSGYTAAVPVSTSATAAAALPTPGPFTTFCNTGAVGVFVRLGNASVAATLGDNFVNAGTCRAFANISGPNYSMISTGAGTSVNLVSGACDRSSCGLGGGGGGSGGGGGGAVTIANGADIVLGTLTDTTTNCTTPITNASLTVDSLLRCIANGIALAPTLGSASGGKSTKLLNALTSSAAVASGAHQRMGFYCYNPNASVIYFQIYDALTVTGTPKESFGVGATTSSGDKEALVGIQYSTGISVQAATTATGSIAPGTAPDCQISWN